MPAANPSSEPAISQTRISSDLSRATSLVGLRLPGPAKILPVHLQHGHRAVPGSGSPVMAASCPVCTVVWVMA